METFVLWTILFITFSVTLSTGADLSSKDKFELMQDLVLPQDLNLTMLLEILGGEHPHTHLDVKGIVELHGYGVEIHTVETSDGYILELQRIIGIEVNEEPTLKIPVLLMHGLALCAKDWVIAGPDKGLGFILADLGYDVWLGNVRGTVYSRKHKWLTTDDSEYWAFSWHEIGIRDLPTCIDYILKVTRHKKLFYIGHSQGTTSFYVMTSELPEYNDKIIAMFSFAPVAYCSNMYSPVFQTLAKLVDAINVITKLIGMYELKPTNGFLKKFTSNECQENSLLQPLCSNVFFLISGFNWEQLDKALLPAVLSYIPAGAGARQFFHYAQLINSGYFRQYDHGFISNLIKYRKFKPPSYNLTNIRAPVSLHYSVNDWLSHPKDVEKLYLSLPNPIGKFLVPDDKFNHFDYLIAKDVKQLVYVKVIDIMRRYSIY